MGLIKDPFTENNNLERDIREQNKRSRNFASHWSGKFVIKGRTPTTQQWVIYGGH